LAVVHVSGDIVMDGFSSKKEAKQWIKDNKDLLEDPIKYYNVVEVIDD
jgi:hypothetical protein